MGLFIELGSSALLFSALFLVERRVVERRVAEIERATEQTVAAIREEVTDVRGEVAALAALGAAMRGRLAGDLEATEEAFQAFDAAPSFQTTQWLLNKAADLKATSSSGVRVGLPSMWERLRFKPRSIEATDGTRHVILVTLEQVDGEPIETLVWDESKSATDLFLEVARVLQGLGKFPGANTFDATEIMTRLRRALWVAISARQGDSGIPADLGPVIEVPGSQWAITEDGIECLEHGYVIERSRIGDGEPKWMKHMSEKTWVDMREFELAFDVATLLFDSRRPERDCDEEQS